MLHWAAPGSNPSLPAGSTQLEPPGSQQDARPVLGTAGARSVAPAAIPSDVAPEPLADPAEAALRQMMRRDFAGLEEVPREDGGASLSLQGRFMHMSAVVMGPDGQSRIQCYGCADELMAAVASPTPAHPLQ